MQKPRISVIIPTFGRPQYLNAAIESVTSQSYPAHEIIVVDDCSPERIQVSSEGIPGLKVLRHARNQGPGAARNTGMAHATGDLILFLDDDDLLASNRLEEAVRGIGRAPMHAMGVEMFSPGNTRLLDGPRFEGDLRRDFPYGPSVGDHPKMGQVVHTRESVLQFDPTLRRGEDTEWWIRLSDVAIFAWTEGTGLRVRVHDGPRDYSSDADMFEVRRQIAQRYGHTSSRAQRAVLSQSVAVAGLRSRRSLQALLWSVRAAIAGPNLKRVKMILRAIIDFALPREKK